MGAKANRAYIAFIEETEWGVLPATPTMQKVNFTGDSLLYNIETTVPDSIRDDRMQSDLINTSAGNEGGYEIEFQAAASGADDPMLLAALWAETWTGPAPATVDVAGAVITASGSNIDFGAGTAQPAAMTPGDKFMVKGSAAGNDGVYTVATAPGADAYTVVETFAADETLPASSISVVGQYAKNGLYQHSFSIERGHLDVTEYFLYLGMVCNEFTLEFTAEELITGGYTFMGKNSTVAQVAAGNSYLDQPTTPFMSAAFNVGNVRLDGSPIQACLLQSIELNINNNVEGKSAVGEFGYCSTAEGEFELTGAINMYFNTSGIYEKFIASEAMALSFELYDNIGNMYQFTIPRFKLSTDAINVEGKNTDVMDAAEYVALYDETEDCALRVDRFMVV